MNGSVANPVPPTTQWCPGYWAGEYIAFKGLDGSRLRDLAFLAQRTWHVQEWRDRLGRGPLPWLESEVLWQQIPRLETAA